MFYKKQNTSILIICLCIIVAGFGFLGGYFVSGYSTSKSYAAKVSSYNKQIAELQEKNKTAESKIVALQKSQSAETSDNSSVSDNTENSESTSNSTSDQKTDEDSSSSSNQTTDENTNADSGQTIDGNSSDETGQSDTTAAKTVDKTTKSPANKKYILKLYNNKPTVFDYTDNKIGDIQTIINIDINALSTADRAMLDKGIVINSEEELAKVLEDYSS